MLDGGLLDGTAVCLWGVSKAYGKSGVLSDVNLAIGEGDFVAIVGASGSGKSTLLHLMGGIDRPTSGRVEVFGEDIGRFGDNELAGFRNKIIGLVFQFFYLQPHLTVEKNLEIPCMPALLPKVERARRVRGVAEMVGMEDKLGFFPAMMSGGELQRVAIARALINRPKIIFADEPTGNLDDANTESVVRLLMEINREQGTTVVVVTHDERIAKLADRIIRLRDGGVVCD
ncbi:MAG: ABC transporter ATP-binding protein [Candidatus Nomurabacteria bacterium]|jgi:putative ABC transport system ATP-binding protein|nr:ABC transporter ATP-binding protein [Candidatus Nomurabacteria bacterium]